MQRKFLEAVKYVLYTAGALIGLLFLVLIVRGV
jgi:hypothetical protein